MDHNEKLQGFKLQLPFSLDSEVVGVKITMALCSVTSSIAEKVWGKSETGSQLWQQRCELMS